MDPVSAAENQIRIKRRYEYVRGSNNGYRGTQLRRPQLLLRTRVMSASHRGNRILPDVAAIGRWMKAEEDFQGIGYGRQLVKEGVWKKRHLIFLDCERGMVLTAALAVLSLPLAPAGGGGRVGYTYERCSGKEQTTRIKDAGEAYCPGVAVDDRGDVVFRSEPTSRRRYLGSSGRESMSPGADNHQR